MASGSAMKKPNSSPSWGEVLQLWTGSGAANRCGAIGVFMGMTSPELGRQPDEFCRTHSRPRPNWAKRSASSRLWAGVQTHKPYCGRQNYKKRSPLCSPPPVRCHLYLFPVGNQRAARHDFDLALPVDRGLFAPLINGSAPDPERVGQLLDAPEVGYGLRGVHWLIRIACYRFGRQPCCTYPGIACRSWKT